MPKGIYSITRSNLEDAPKGVIFCLKDMGELDENSYSNNAIFPYHLCYINENGASFIAANNPKRCLDYFKKLCIGKNEILPELVAAFDKETKGNKKMDAYVELLKAAIVNIKGADDEAGLDTLATPGGTKMNKELGKNDYELISYLVIK
jgi:hypothetical protein